MIDITFGVVELVAGLRIDAANRADHLGGKQDVVDGIDLGKQIDARLMVNAGIEPNMFFIISSSGGRLLLSEARDIGPNGRRRAAAMWDDQAQRWEILEQVAHDQLHKSGGIRVDVVRAGSVEVRIAGTR